MCRRQMHLFLSFENKLVNGAGKCHNFPAFLQKICRLGTDRQALLNSLSCLTYFVTGVRVTSQIEGWHGRTAIRYVRIPAAIKIDGDSC